MTGRVLDVPRAVAAVREVVGPSEFAPLHEPELTALEKQYVTECLDSGWVSYLGAFVDRFDQALARLCGVEHAVSVVNGTNALHLCLLVAGVETGDEVLCPTLTFVGTPNAVRYCGAEPHFIDSEPGSLGVDVPKLEEYLAVAVERRDDGSYNVQTGRRIAAIVPVHVFGHPCDLDPLQVLCERYGIAMVEDAAESIGSAYKGEPTGRHGRVAALSFNGNKVVTTGGGGAVLTNDAGLAARVRHLSTTARIGNGYFFEHDEVGFNLRLPNLNAALGCAQLDRLPDMLARKRTLAERYAEALSKVSGVTFCQEPAYARSNYWLNAVLVEGPGTESRDAFLEATNAAGLGTRPAWTLMHTLPMYNTQPAMRVDGAIELARKLVNLPSSPALVAPPSFVPSAG